MTKYVIETDTFVTGWVNCSTDEDGYPLAFDTREEAQDELGIHLFMLGLECDLGNIEDVNPEDYRITEVTE
jgi:hypothetical protein